MLLAQRRRTFMVLAHAAPEAELHLKEAELGVDPSLALPAAACHACYGLQGRLSACFGVLLHLALRRFHPFWT